jgi:hypothetical protein
MLGVSHAGKLHCGLDDAETVAKCATQLISHARLSPEAGLFRAVTDLPAREQVRHTKQAAPSLPPIGSVQPCLAVCPALGYTLSIFSAAGGARPLTDPPRDSCGLSQAFGAARGRMVELGGVPYMTTHEELAQWCAELEVALDDDDDDGGGGGGDHALWVGMQSTQPQQQQQRHSKGGGRGAHGRAGRRLRPNGTAYVKCASHEAARRLLDRAMYNLTLLLLSLATPWLLHRYVH